jgi:uracil-DNA glycosylase family 4
MHRAGFANQPTSLHRGDGLRLAGAWVSSAVKCAPPDNKPAPDERDACLPFLLREIRALPSSRAIVCLGGFGWDAALRTLRELGHAFPPRCRASGTGWRCGSTACR